MSARDGWTVVVPAKPPGIAKSRLIGLGQGARRRLAEAFVGDVLDSLADAHCVASVALLASERIGSVSASGAARIRRMHDEGRGLNRELLAAAQQLGRPLAFLTADLPCLGPDDVDRLLVEARDVSVGVVPDHTGRGTTALTFSGRTVFAGFGRESHRRHREWGAVTIGTSLPAVRLDVDVPDDLLQAEQLGLRPRTVAALLRTREAGGLSRSLAAMSR